MASASASSRAPKAPLNWQDGTIYPVLRHLEQQGLVTSKWQHPKEGRQRRYYRLTPRGRRVCQQLRHQWTTSTRAITALLHRPADCAQN